MYSDIYGSNGVMYAASDVSLASRFSCSAWEDVDLHKRIVSYAKECQRAFCKSGLDFFCAIAQSAQRLENLN